MHTFIMQYNDRFAQAEHHWKLTRLQIGNDLFWAPNNGESIVHLLPIKVTFLLASMQCDCKFFLFDC